MSQLRHSKTPQRLVRQILGKLTLPELVLLQELLSDSTNSFHDLRAEVAQMVANEIEPSRREYFVDYDKQVVTAFFGSHQPEPDLKVQPTEDRAVYATWLSEESHPFFQSMWRNFTYVRCSLDEFGIYLKNRFGPNHMSRDFFNYSGDDRREVVAPTAEAP